jgi:hypothetical protein
MAIDQRSLERRLKDANERQQLQAMITGGEQAAKAGPAAKGF